MQYSNDFKNKQEVIKENLTYITNLLAHWI